MQIDAFFAPFIFLLLAATISMSFRGHTLLLGSWLTRKCTKPTMPLEFLYTKFEVIDTIINDHDKI